MKLTCWPWVLVWVWSSVTGSAVTVVEVVASPPPAATGRGGYHDVVGALPSLLIASVVSDEVLKFPRDQPADRSAAFCGEHLGAPDHVLVQLQRQVALRHLAEPPTVSYVDHRIARTCPPCPPPSAPPSPPASAAGATTTSVVGARRPTSTRAVAFSWCARR